MLRSGGFAFPVIERLPLDTISMLIKTQTKVLQVHVKEQMISFRQWQHDCHSDTKSFDYVQTLIRVLLMESLGHAGGFHIHGDGMAAEGVEDVGGAGEVENEGIRAVVSCSRRLHSKNITTDSPLSEYTTN